MVESHSENPQIRGKIRDLVASEMSEMFNGINQPDYRVKFDFQGQNSRFNGGQQSWESSLN
jgi:hypothetical protein